MDRAEHLAWCKQRALACVDRGELVDAIASMLSDLYKHPETKRSVKVGVMLACALSLDAADARRWVEGFN